MPNFWMKKKGGMGEKFSEKRGFEFWGGRGEGFIFVNSVLCGGRILKIGWVRRVDFGG